MKLKALFLVVAGTLSCTVSRVPVTQSSSD